MTRLLLTSPAMVCRDTLSLPITVKNSVECLHHQYLMRSSKLETVMIARKSHKENDGTYC
jgi:hypothetical protein